MPLDLTCTNEQKIKITASPKTETGRPASLDGPLTARVISGTGIAMGVSGEPNSLYLISGDEPGDTSYVIEADADLGSGVVLIQDTVVLHVTGAMATNLGLAASPPEAK